MVTQKLTTPDRFWRCPCRGRSGAGIGYPTLCVCFDILGVFYSSPCWMPCGAHWVVELLLLLPIDCGAWRAPRYSSQGTSYYEGWCKILTLPIVRSPSPYSWDFFGVDIPTLQPPNLIQKRPSSHSKSTHIRLGCIIHILHIGCDLSTQITPFVILFSRTSQIPCIRQCAPHCIL